MSSYDLIWRLILMLLAEKNNPSIEEKTKEKED